MARRTRWWVVVALIAGLLIVGAAVGAFVLLRSIPPMADQIPPGFSGTVVQMVSPGRRTEWPMNSFVPVLARAESAASLERVELFVNGQLYDSQTADGRTSASAGWMWQPGTEGTFVLVAKAISALGGAGISEPVVILATAPSSSSSPVAAQEGDSLETLAEANGVSLEELQRLNPTIDPLAGLATGTPISIPNEPAPVTNPKIIPGLELTPVNQAGGGEGDGPAEPPAPPGEDQPPPAQPNFLDNLQFMLHLGSSGGGQGEEGSGPQLPPPAPGVAADFDGCDVRLRIDGWFYDSSDPLAVRQDEDGFFIYRSRDGNPFERIHTLPPIRNPNDDDLRKFVDPQQFGDLTYYVSAFNSLGESPSNPVVVPLNAANCAAPERGSAGLSQASMAENGDLTLPWGMDTAYLYLQINRARAVRVPEGDRTFLPASGIPFNLYTYLDSIGVQAPDLDLAMEVWGWSGGELKYVGALEVELHRTVLTICSVPGEGGCTGSGGGDWVMALTLPEGQEIADLKYEVRWRTTALSEADQLYVQLSAAPFFSDAYNGTKNLLYAGHWPAKGSEGVFLYHLGSVLYPTPPHPMSQLGWGQSDIFEYTTNGFNDKPGQPFTVYLRLSPRLAMSGLARTSNIVPLLYQSSPPPSDLPPLASKYPSLFEVEILEDTYKAPQFLDPQQWGCVVIDEDPTGTFAVGQIVCPGKIGAHDDCADTPEALCLLKGLGNAIGFLYDQFAFAYETYKSIIAQGVQAIIPGCSEDDACKDIVHKGVDYGASYVTGLPADMPKSEDLIADSVAEFIVQSATEAEMYYTGYDESAIGLFCDLADCEEVISDYIKSELKKSRSLAAQPACINGYEAYFHGQQPACLDPSIIVHAAPNSGNYAAAVVLRITRKSTPESLAAPSSDVGYYQILVTARAEKPGDSGQVIEGALYAPTSLALVWLDPGESIDLPVPLALLGEQGAVTRYLYFDSTTHLKAVESCYSPDSSWDWVPCLEGGLDAWDFENPPSIEGALDSIEEDASQ